MAKSPKERPPSSGILLFILGFLGSLLLCAAAFYVWWRVTDPVIPWLPFTQTEEPTPTAPVEDDALYHASDRFAHAVYITDDKGALQSLTLVMACPDTDSITVVGMPLELHLSTTDEADTLLRRFRADGVDAANAALAAVLPSAPHYYSVLSYAQVEGLFGALGAKLNVSLPKDVDEAADDGSYSVHLTAGDHALKPRQITNLMRCTDWQSGRRERADMHALLVTSYLDQFLTPSRTISADYSHLCAYSTTNLPEERFPTVSTEWEYLARSQADTSPTLLHVSGVYEGAGATLRFTMTTELSQQLTACWYTEESVVATPS